MDTQQLADKLSGLTVMETCALIKELEQRWGVKAAPPSVVVEERGAPTSEPEQTEFTVELTAFPADKKMVVLKTVREVCGLGLKEAKDFVESVPKVLKEAVTKAEAEELKAKFADATITVR